ncbi:MAG: hypothetical protein BWY89_01288 [Bacteroidetes bacterium ADurb.BinA012]|nr:MAG: hypothetical protein BWY89_01288 [Bacteroidetes bacterium ADurb.BinA012]
MFMTLPVVVGIETSQFAKSCIALHQNEMLILVNVKGSLVGVFNLPYKHQTYLDGVSVLVVHLDGFAVKVARPE